MRHRACLWRAIKSCLVLVIMAAWCNMARAEECMAMAEEHAMWEHAVRTDTPQDTVPSRRNRKTASGHARKRKIEEVKDSVAERARQVVDSLKNDTLVAKGDTIIAKEDTLIAKGDTIVLDSAKIVALSDSLLQATLHRKKPGFKPDPIRSMWLGLVFPGGGQIYNRKYWKLPIFYGGFLGCVYALNWNGQMLRDYSQAYLDIMDSDPNTKSYEQMLPLGYDITGKEERFKEIFKNKKNYFRKYRDMSIFAFAGVYLLAVIDAYVDAELASFDISPDLSMRLEPTFLNTGMGGTRFLQTSPGIQCSITF